MNTRLIINADDYGRTPGVSHSIRAAHLKGVVTSTTCMMNLPDTPSDIQLALQQTPRLGLGVHLVLTTGRPILSPERVPTLCDANGGFMKLEALTSHLDQVNIDEAQAEWRAQIDRFIQVSGRKPTHLDSHHHSSYFSTRLFRAMLELARDYKCGIRLPVMDKVHWNGVGFPDEMAGSVAKDIPALIKEFNTPSPDGFIGSFYDNDATEKHLIKVIEELRDGTFEIMCHPGYADADLEAVSSYNHSRERELTILTDPSIAETVRTRSIQLINFGEIG